MEHPTPKGYTNGCHCRECLDAHAARQRRYRAEAKVKADRMKLELAELRDFKAWVLAGDTVNITCVMCGAPASPVPALVPGYDALAGTQLDYWWLCAEHREELTPPYGKPPSPAPGEPEVTAQPSAVTRLKLLRPDLFPQEATP